MKKPIMEKITSKFSNIYNLFSLGKFQKEKNDKQKKIQKNCRVEKNIGG